MKLTNAMQRSHHLLLAVILTLAFALRVGYALTQDPLAPYARAGGDTWWYLEYGYRQVVDVEMEPLSPAPLYLILLGSVRWLLQQPGNEPVLLAAGEGGGVDVYSVPGPPSAATVIVIRLLQAILGTATCYFVFRIAWALTEQVSTGLVAAAVLATSVTMVVDAAQIMTEPLYLFFVTAAMMIYAEQAATDPTAPRRVWLMALAGGLFGLATLTRAVFLLFPVGVLIHAALVIFADRRRGLRPRLSKRSVALLLAVYVGVLSIWTVYYALRWNQFVVGAKGMTAFLYIGSQSEWAGPEAVDSALGVEARDDEIVSVEAEDYLAGAGDTIRANPLGYLQTRLSDLAKAYAQPFGTAFFRGESLRALVFNWLRQDRSFNGLVRLVRADAFFPKLAVYIVHFGGLGLGLVGMWLYRARWRVTLLLVGFIAYVTLLHLVLDAIPRYIYPTLPFWWCFGAAALTTRWWPRRPRSSRPAQPHAPVTYGEY